MLKRDLIRLRAQLNDGRLTRGQTSRLAAAPRLPFGSRHRVVGADVIAVSRGPRPALELDVGRREGIRQSTTVLNASGLVGTVISVRQWTCTVRATAKGAVVGVRLAGGNQVGWATGTTRRSHGQALLALHLLGAHRSVTPGERLVTFASVGGRPYRRRSRRGGLPRRGQGAHRPGPHWSGRSPTSPGWGPSGWWSNQAAGDEAPVAAVTASGTASPCSLSWSRGSGTCQAIDRHRLHQAG